MNKRTETGISKGERYVPSITNIERLRFKERNFCESERFKQSNRRMLMSRLQTKSRIILFKKVELGGTELYNRRQRNARHNFSVTELKSLCSKNRLTDCSSFRSQEPSNVQNS